MFDKITLNAFLPESLIETAISLKKIGIFNYAWEKKDIIEIIKIIYLKERIILGGDIYTISNDTIEPTYENWYYIPSEIKSHAEHVGASCEMAYKSINDHSRACHGNFIYSLCFHK